MYDLFRSCKFFCPSVINLKMQVEIKVCTGSGQLGSHVPHLVQSPEYWSRCTIALRTMLLFAVQIILIRHWKAKELTYMIPVQLASQSSYFWKTHFDLPWKIFNMFPSQAVRNMFATAVSIQSFVDHSPILGLKLQSCTIKFSTQSMKKAMYFCGSTPTQPYILEIKDCPSLVASRQWSSSLEPCSNTDRPPFLSPSPARR